MTPRDDQRLPCIRVLRADGAPVSLTLPLLEYGAFWAGGEAGGVLGRGALAEAAVGPSAVVLLPPALDGALRVSEVEEELLVQAFIPAACR
jgi:hypothetical protein